MLDALSLDQLVMFAAVVDEGSFSAAARRLRRVQSAVSHAMGNLERELGVALWDRSSRIPTLTPEGNLLLARARRVIAEADGLRGLARELAGGVEPRITLAIDTFFPLGALVDAVRAFRETYPAVELCVQTETLSATSELVRDGTCDVGIVSEDADLQGLTRTHGSSVRMVTVAAPGHPLAALRGKLSAEQLAAHVQIVMSERGRRRGAGPEHAVLSPQTWRVADLETKRALLVGGIGWGNMPEHAIVRDLERGRLVRIRPAAFGDDGIEVALVVVNLPRTTFGPALTWLLARLAAQCDAEVAEAGAAARPRPAPRAARVKKPARRRAR